MLDELKRELEQLSAAGRHQELFPVASRKDGIIEMKGRVLVDFSSWDIFNLNNTKKFKFAVQKEVEHSGFGAASPRLVSGTSPAHAFCESRLARFLGCDAALLFSGKNQAVLSLVTALAGEGDLVLADESMQGPISDAAYLMNCTFASFSLSNLQTLKEALERNKSARRKLLFVEALSPLTGKKAELTTLASLALQYDLKIFVDESYALGICGLRGAGGYEQSGLTDRPFCLFGSSAHTLASYGAFIAGSKILMDYLLHRSRTFAHESAPPPALAVAIENALDALELNQAVRERVLLSAARLRHGLNLAAIIGSEDSDVPFICIPLKSFQDAKELQNALFMRGFFVEIATQGLPFSEACIVRIMPSVHHTDKQLDGLLEAFVEVFSKLVKK